jgi:ketosteroid isomerase-like protein
MKTPFSFLLLIACIGAVSAQTKEQKAQAVTDILVVMDNQVSAWNRGDVDGFMKGYWNSPKLIFVSGDNVTRGWQPTLDRYKKNYDSKEKMGKLEFKEVELNILSPDAAVVLGSWHLARDKDEPHGKFTLVFRKFPEGWCIIMDHTS